jgi:hypothetical protein
MKINTLFVIISRSFFLGLRNVSTSKNTKILMYKVLTRPVLTCASETWTVSITNERRLSMFERKVLRCIFGAKQENGA